VVSVRDHGLRAWRGPAGFVVSSGCSGAVPDVTRYMFELLICPPRRVSTLLPTPRVAPVLLLPKVTLETTTTPRLISGGGDPSADQPEVSLVHGQACLQRAGPAKPLKPDCDLGVIQSEVVAAVGADDLEQAGVAAFRLAVDDPDVPAGSRTLRGACLTCSLGPIGEFPRLPGSGAAPDATLPRVIALLKDHSVNILLIAGKVICMRMPLA
jgi:hypothetical protein